MNYTEVTKFDYDPANAGDKIASMKYLFLARFAKEGRTLEAAYSAWGALTFDPNKDDIEQFILKVEELAKKLGYNQDAQLMAVKSVLPRDVYGICMTYKTLKELKDFLMELFSNPKMREAASGTASAVGEPDVFSIGQHMESNVVSPTAADISKIHQDMNDLQVRFNKITSADLRNKSSKPWKPEVTPPRRRGGFNQGRGGRQFDNAQRNDRFKNSESNSNQDRDNGQRNNTVNFRGRGQGKGNFRGNMRGKGRGRGRFDKSRIKCEAKTEDWPTSDQYMRVTGRYGNEKSKEMQDSEKQIELVRKPDPYPWLTEDDPRRHQTDEEILYEKVDLSNSALSRKEKTRLMKMLIKYRDAFSLRDQIGECPNLKADIKVIDDSPFFVRPFPISENDKPFMDDQMERLVSLGILSKNSTSHTSPVMSITRKLTKDKRPVVDFRLLNTRILRRNTSIPLMSDVLSILGNSKCEVDSCVDIKDAYHSIRLTEMSKEYCGILPYFGSPIYRYEVLPMGIACAPRIWMDYITLILSELEDKKKYIAIMDDLLIHSTRADHWKLLEQLLKSMCKNGLRLSLKKCQLFKTNLIYMRNEFTITKNYSLEIQNRSNK